MTNKPTQSQTRQMQAWLGGKEIDPLDIRQGNGCWRVATHPGEVYFYFDGDRLVDFIVD